MEKHESLPAGALALKRKDYLPIILECQQEETEETEKQFSAISVSFR
jgi:hypothetical protein